MLRLALAENANMDNVGEAMLGLVGRGRDFTCIVNYGVAKWQQLAILEFKRWRG